MSATVQSSTEQSENRPEYPEGFPDVFGKYVLLRPMARGGMGELFLAAAGETGGFEKLCVVKKVLHSLADAAVHRRFLDEAKVVVRLNHANLVQVFDAGKANNEHYLAMELVEGKDLRAVWNRCAQLHRRIPVDVAMFVMREVLRGLDYVHDAMELNLVHRDISPPNILVGYRGDVKLTDFGLAKSSIKRERTSPGVVFGRYSYLSPEQAKGLPADRRTDIYACAIVLWELLTGRQLFPSSNRSHQDALAAVRDPNVKPPSAVVPGIPEGMDGIVLKGLARSPADRYDTAAEFRDRLSDVLARDYPKCNADRVTAFMRDIFAREIRVEQREYVGFAGEDFSELRAQHGPVDLISIRDLRKSGDESMELAESDIVELDAQGRSWDEGQPDRKSLEKAARSWVGKVVASRYRIDALIGVGGMGAVFRATHLALDKSFALKFLHSIYTRDSDVITRFMREARAAKDTGHPNIVDVIDIGSTEEGNNVYYVMELLEGADVAAVVNGEGPLAVRRAVHIARQICRALSAAHDAGIIHRDLKAENVVLTLRGKDPDFVKVLDFGICKQTGDIENSTTPGLIMGSPEYMAPEQGAGLEATVAADIYSVGCIMFKMLTGRLPFVGRNPVDVLMQKGAHTAPRVTEFRPEVPVALADVVARCLERHPGDRPPSMRALEYELTRALDGRANAVAAVLGLDEESSDDETLQSASASLSMQRVAVESMDDLGSSGELSEPKSSRRRPMPAVRTSPAKVASAESSGSRGIGRAFAFVLLGGVLAAGGVVALAPDTFWSALGMTDAVAPGSSQTPRAKSASDLSAPVSPLEEPVPAESAAVTPAPTVDGADAAPSRSLAVDATDTGIGDNGDSVTPQEPAEAGVVPVELQPDELKVSPSVEELVKIAEGALAEQRYREPYEASLAKSLAELRIADPGNENIARLRDIAVKQLEPSAQTAVQNKDWALAAKNYREIIDIWPDHPDAKSKLKDVLIEHSRELRSTERYEQALALADELLNLDSDDFQAVALRADMLYAMSRWDEAKDAYARAKKLKPRNKHVKSRYSKASRNARRAAAREAAEAKSVETE